MSANTVINPPVGTLTPVQLAIIEMILIQALGAK
jgi:hypothetical protein